MNWACSLPIVITVLGLSNNSSEGALPSVAKIIQDSLGLSQDDSTDELSVLMDHLDRRYIPNCLRVVVTTHESNEGFNSSVALDKQAISEDLFFNNIKPLYERNLDIIPETEPIIHFDTRHMSLTKLQRTLNYIIANTHKLTPFNCVSYWLPSPPESRLMLMLTDATTSKWLARYFLVHTQNSTEAKQFLLDHRMRKEENVAALVQEESQNKSYWRVLIRQLLHPSGSPQVLTVNRWSRDTGLTSTENIFPEQMDNFYGQKLTAITLEYIPLIMFTKTKGSLKVKLKPCAEKFLLDTVSKKLNFTYEVVNPADGHWGYPNEKGQFVGLVREVEVERANFSLALTITQVRSRAIEYTYSHERDNLVFITAKSRPSPPWSKILTPFRLSVWLCVLVSVGGGSLLYHIIYHAQATLTSSRLLSSHALMHVLASFLSQSLHSYLSLQAGRVFLGFWFLYAFLVTSYYKTSLISNLAVPFVPSNIDTLEDLMQSGLTYGITPSKGAIYSIFATATIPTFQKMFTNMDYYSTPESIKMVDEGHHAFIYWKRYLHPRVARHNNNPKRKNDIHISKEKFFPGHKGWPMPKGVPYKRTFSDVMKRCVQAGLVDKWMEESLAISLKEWQKEDHNTEGGVTMTDTRKKVKEVVFSLDHLQGPFFMLLLGYLGGVLLLILEVLV